MNPYIFMGKIWTLFPFLKKLQKFTSPPSPSPKEKGQKLTMTFMSTNYDIIVIFPIYGQFGAMQKPNSGWMICNTYIFINSNLLSYKNWKQN